MFPGANQVVVFFGSHKTSDLPNFAFPRPAQAMSLPCPTMRTEVLQSPSIPVNSRVRPLKRQGMHDMAMKALARTHCQQKLGYLPVGFCSDIRHDPHVADSGTEQCAVVLHDAALNVIWDGSPSTYQHAAPAKRIESPSIPQPEQPCFYEDRSTFLDNSKPENCS